MRILVITPQLPCLRGGAHVRQYHLLRRLCHRHEITVVSLATTEEMPGAPILEALGIRTIVVPFNPTPSKNLWKHRLQTWRRHLLDLRPIYAFTYPLTELEEAVTQTLAQDQPDLAQLEHLFVAPCAHTLGRLPWVLTAMDVESQKAQRNASLAERRIERIMGRLEAIKLANWERTWVRRSKACIAVSELDAARLREFAPNTSVFVVPNGVDAAFFAPNVEGKREHCEILFFGNLGYLPNQDAVTLFAKEIFPKIRASVDGVRFRVVGPNASPEVVQLGNLPGIDYVGYVSDIRSELWRATISVVPLRSGGGTRLKILESLAACCAVVSTTVGAEGLDLVKGQEIVIADGTEAFAAAVVHLLENSERRRHIVIAGERAAQRYDWEHIAAAQELAYETIRASRIAAPGMRK